MDEDIVTEVSSYLTENERLSFAYVNHYYFNFIYKGEFRNVALTKQGNVIYYLLNKDFRNRVNRLIRSSLKQLRFHPFDEQSCSQVLQAVIDSGGSGLKPPSLPLAAFTIALPEAKSLQFRSIITTDLTFVQFLQPALMKVTNLSISFDKTFNQSLLVEIFSFLEAEGSSLGLQSLTLTGFSDSVYTLPYISTLKELIIKHSSIILDSKYEDTNHEFDTIRFEVNKVLQEFKLQNIRKLRIQLADIEDISFIHTMEDVNIASCPKIKYFPVIFPPSESTIIVAKKLFIDITTTTTLSLFCDGFDRFSSSFQSENPKELKNFSITGVSTLLGEQENLSIKQHQSIDCCRRNSSWKYCKSNTVEIQHFQLSSIVRLPMDEQLDDRRYVHLFSPAGEQHLNSFESLSNISVNILFKKFSWREEASSFHSSPFVFEEKPFVIL